MSNLRRGLLISLCCLPGTIATLFLVLAIANGGVVFGLSLDWLRNCSLLAVPMLTSVIALLLMILSRREREQRAEILQHERSVSRELLTSESDRQILLVNKEQ